MEDNSPGISSASPGIYCGDESSGSIALKPHTGEPIVIKSFIASQSHHSLNAESFSNLDESKEMKDANLIPKKKYKEIRGIKLRFGPKHISKILSTKKCIY